MKHSGRKERVVKTVGGGGGERGGGEGDKEGEREETLVGKAWTEEGSCRREYSLLPSLLATTTE